MTASILSANRSTGSTDVDTFGLPDDELRRSTIAALERIYLTLGGDLAVLETKATPLRGDFIHMATGTLIELDQSQHFTSFRLRALEMYPPDVPLGFDKEKYMQLCRTWQSSPTTTCAPRKPSTGVGGRQRQRAYYDALRGLTTPSDGAASADKMNAADIIICDAYRRHRNTLTAALNG